MTQTIKSRNLKHTPAYQEALQEVAEQFAIELDMLVDKIDSFLEMRIAAEFDELRDDIKQMKTINDALMEENIRLGEKLAQKGTV